MILRFLKRWRMLEKVGEKKSLFLSHKFTWEIFCVFWEKLWKIKEKFMKIIQISDLFKVAVK